MRSYSQPTKVMATRQLHKSFGMFHIWIEHYQTGTNSITENLSWWSHISIQVEQNFYRQVIENIHTRMYMAQDRKAH